MISIQLVEQAWKRFDEIKNCAEQHQFVILMKFDLILTAAYRDLHNNWDEDHARRFLVQMNKMFVNLGHPDKQIEIPD